MLSLALRIAYDGGFFDAYPRDPRVRNVEDCLIEALRPEGFVKGSFRTGSRTDKGVSALENVVRVHLERPHTDGLIPAVQSRLPPGLWLTGVAEVPKDWNPRHAKMRQYSYLARKRGESLPDMQIATAAFVGTHDMRAFAKIEDRNPERVIESFTVEDGPQWRFTIRSRGFLWNQVRRMVDAVLWVGRGVDVALIHEALQTGMPDPRFGVAPAEGLLLERVEYDLRWLDAGRLPPPKIEAQQIQARVRATLADHLASL